jgi:hypothetical protein
VDVLARIKRLLVRGQYRFTLKALVELETDGLEEMDAIEAILNASAIKKVLKSTSPFRPQRIEKLYIIEGRNYDGTLIYTKGKISQEAGEEIVYIYISAKQSTSTG